MLTGKPWIKARISVNLFDFLENVPLAKRAQKVRVTANAVVLEILYKTQETLWYHRMPSDSKHEDRNK